MNLFIKPYIIAYEAGDIDKLMSLYSNSAMENNGLRLDDIKREYQKNFQGKHYRYVLGKVQIQKGDGQ